MEQKLTNQNKKGEIGDERHKKYVDSRRVLHHMRTKSCSLKLHGFMINFNLFTNIYCLF